MGYKVKVEESNTRVIDLDTRETIRSNNELLVYPYRAITLTIFNEDETAVISELHLVLLQEDNLTINTSAYNKDDTQQIKLTREAIKQLIKSNEFMKDINDYDVLYDYSDIYSGIISIGDTAIDNKCYEAITDTIDDIDSIVYEAFKIHIRCLVLDSWQEDDIGIMLDSGYKTVDKHIIDGEKEEYDTVIRDYMDYYYKD